MLKKSEDLDYSGETTLAFLHRVPILPPAFIKSTVNRLRVSLHSTACVAMAPFPSQYPCQKAILGKTDEKKVKRGKSNKLSRMLKGNKVA